ncbi:MAG: NHL repeat-containing protein [Chloroflexota bacterium]
MTAKRPWRRLLAAAAALAIAAPSTLLVPAAALAAGPAAPNVTASGPNVFQKTPNGPIYFKPTTGRTSGTYLRTYGLAPTSEYRRPSDVVALGSYVYVLDAGNYRIVKRKASDLSFVKVSASIAARVSEPKRMASDGTYLYITDYDGGRIVVYRVSTLAYVGSFGSSGSGTGHFSHPIGIAAAGGHVYVADTVNSRLVKLSTWPIKWQKAYGSAGSGTGHFTFPQGLAVIGSYLYVADTGNARIVRLSTALSATGWKAVTSVGSPAAPLNGIDELATDGTSLYAHVQSGPALVKLTSSLGFVKRLVSPSGASHWGDLIGLGASKAGLFLTHIAVDKGSASYNNQISRHSLTSLAVAKVSGDKHPYSANQWDMPYSATSDGTNLYVGDIGRILVCPLAGTTCTRTIGLPEGYEAYAMTTFGGDLYVVDYLGNRMFVVNIDTGTISFQLGTLGSGDDQLNGPSGIVYMASLGQIFILDSGNNRVVARNAATLAFVAKAGTHGSSPGQLGYPMGMAGDQGFLYIADTGNNRVAKWFAASLTEAAASPGGFGTGSGQFDSPTGIATDGDSVWVSDIGNQRVQRLSVLNLGYLSQQKSSSTMPFPGGGVSGLASIGGKLLLIDVRRGRAYLEYGGGPLAVTVAPSDATVPRVTGFDWVGAAPAGWTSRPMLATSWPRPPPDISAGRPRPLAARSRPRSI